MAPFPFSSRPLALRDSQPPMPSFEDLAAAFDTSPPAATASAAAAVPAASAEEQGLPEGHRPRRRWTPEEDKQLIAAVNKYGSQRGPGSQWSKISAGLPGRTNKDCRKRWFHSLDPRVRKGRWSPDEDELLRTLYAELGPQWKEIALRIPGRKDDQVSKRWRDVLAPELTSKKPWSAEEDALLLQLLEEKGPKWTAIAEQLPGRSPIACRNRSRKYRKPTSTNTTTTATTVQTDASTPTGRSDSSGHRSSPEQYGDMDVDMLLQSHANSMANGAGQGDAQHNAGHNHPPNDWHLPNLGVPSVEALDLAFNFDMSAAAPMSAGVGPGVTAAEAGILESWLATVGGGSTSTSSNSSATAASAQLQNVPSTDSVATMSTLSANDKPLQVLYGHSEVPVNNVWSLLLALDRGEHSVNVSSELLRQLLTDGCPPKPKQQSLSVELS